MKREDIYWHLIGISPSLAIHVCFDVVNGMHWLRQIILIKYTHLQMPYSTKSTQSSASPPFAFLAQVQSQHCGQTLIHLSTVALFFHTSK